MMIVFRSLAFNVFVFSWTAIFLLVMVFLLPLPGRFMRTMVRGWAVAAMTILKMVVGLGFEIRGRENLPEGPVILASKHQSAWDTAVFFLLVRDPIYVMKKELLTIPFWGWCARRSESIGVDRDGGASALKQLVADVLAAVNKGNQVIIFPEGTRTPPGTQRPYHPGIAAIYARTEVPVVPVALNSGLYWGRRSFSKLPGTVLVEFLPPMPQGLNRRAFMAELESRVETATDRLIEEGRVKEPTGESHHRN